MRIVAAWCMIFAMLIQSVSAFSAKVEVQESGDGLRIYGETLYGQDLVSVMAKEDGKIRWMDTRQSDENGEYSLDLFFKDAAPSDIYNVNVSANGQTLGSAASLDVLEKAAQFEDDFSADRGLWKLAAGNDFLIKDGWLQSINNGSIPITYLDGDPTTLWKDFCLEFRFQFHSKIKDAGWLGVYTGYNADGRVGIPISPANFNYGENYDCRIICRYGENPQVYTKAADETEYTFLQEGYNAVLGNGTYERGSIGFGACNNIIWFDNVRIVNLEESALQLARKPIVLRIGDTVTADIYNKTEAAVSFSSSDGAVASVDSDGKITALAAGTATITVTAGGASDSCSVIVQGGMTDLHLLQNQLRMKLGDVENVPVYASPSNVYEGDIVWKSSDESVAQLIGTSAKARSVKAVGIGEAVITISSERAGVEEKVYVTLKEPDSAAIKSSVASAAEEGYLIEPYVFGMHHPLAGSITPSRTGPWYTEQAMQLFRDIKVKILRGPDGVVSNRYMYKTGDTTEVTLNSPENGLYLSDIYGGANELDVPYCFCVNITTQTMDEVVEEIGELVKQTDKEVFVELGNEIHANAQFASPRDYFEYCKEVYTRVKPLYPNVKLGVVVVTENEEHIYADGPSTYLGSWNNIAAEYRDYYDAVIPHYYSTLLRNNHYTAEEMASLLNGYNRLLNDALYEDFAQFGKESWITEWGILIGPVFHEKDTMEMARNQFAKNSFVALHNLERLLDMMKSRHVEIATYHNAVDGQGFGLCQGLGNLPNYYTFRCVGEILDEYGYMYDVDFDAVTSEKVDLYEFLIKRNIVMDVPDVGAWGFGDADGIKKIMVFNRSKDKNRFQLKGKSISRLWEYGGADAMAHYLDPADPDAPWHQYPANIELPREYDGESYEDSALLEPYSFTVFEVKDADNAVFSVSVAEGDNKVDPNEPIILTFSQPVEEAPSDLVKLFCDGEEIGFTAEKLGDAQYRLATSSFTYDTPCRMTVNYGGKTNTFSWRTMKAPDYMAIPLDFSDDFTNGTENWSISGTNSIADGELHLGGATASVKGKQYEDFVLEFDMKRYYSSDVDDTGALTFTMDGGSEGKTTLVFDATGIDYYDTSFAVPPTWQTRYYTNSAAFAFKPNVYYHFRIVRWKDTILVYAREEGETDYKQAFKVEGIMNRISTLSFGMSDDVWHSIRNFSVKGYAPLTASAEAAPNGILLSFSEAVDQDTVSEESIRLYENGALIRSDITAVNDKSLLVTPTGGLTEGYIYRINANGSLKGTAGQSLFGNAFSKELTVDSAGYTDELMKEFIMEFSVSYQGDFGFSVGEAFVLQFSEGKVWAGINSDFLARIGEYPFTKGGSYRIKVSHRGGVTEVFAAPLTGNYLKVGRTTALAGSGGYLSFDTADSVISSVSVCEIPFATIEGAYIDNGDAVIGVSFNVPMNPEMMTDGNVVLYVNDTQAEGTIEPAAGYRGMRIRVPDAIIVDYIRVVLMENLCDMKNNPIASKEATVCAEKNLFELSEDYYLISDSGIEGLSGMKEGKIVSDIYLKNNDIVERTLSIVQALYRKDGLLVDYELKEVDAASGEAVSIQFENDTEGMEGCYLKTLFWDSLVNGFPIVEPKILR